MDDAVVHLPEEHMCFRVSQPCSNASDNLAQSRAGINDLLVHAHEDHRVMNNDRRANEDSSALVGYRDSLSVRHQQTAEGRLPKTCAKTVLRRAFWPSALPVENLKLSRTGSLDRKRIRSNLWEIPDDDCTQSLGMWPKIHKQRTKLYQKTK